MSFNALRASLRNGAAVRRAAASRAAPRAVKPNAFVRPYSTGPEAKSGSSSTAIWLGLGAAAAAGGAYYYFQLTESGKEAGTALKSGAQVAKVKANFVPTKEDYIKVRLNFFIVTSL